MLFRSFDGATEQEILDMLKIAYPDDIAQAKGLTPTRTQAQKSKSGFTFVELLIVIAIIAILGAIGIVSYGHIRRTAYDSKVDSMLNQAEKAIISFNTKNTPPLDNSWNILAEMKRQGYVDDRFLQQLNDFAPIRRYEGSYIEDRKSVV